MRFSDCIRFHTLDFYIFSLALNKSSYRITHHLFLNIKAFSSRGSLPSYFYLRGEAFMCSLWLADIKNHLLMGSLTNCFNWIFGCGGRIWTYDLQVMSLTSYRAAPPRANKLNWTLKPGINPLSIFEISPKGRQLQRREAKYLNVDYLSLAGLATTYSPTP